MITFVALAHMVDATKHMGLFTHFDCQKERFAIEKYKILSSPGPLRRDVRRSFDEFFGNKMHDRHWHDMKFVASLNLLPPICNAFVEGWALLSHGFRQSISDEEILFRSFRTAAGPASGFRIPLQFLILLFQFPNPWFQFPNLRFRIRGSSF